MNTKQPRILHCQTASGFSEVVRADPAHISAKKNSTKVLVEFAPFPLKVQTLEGEVEAQTGDAIITGILGERWPVSRERFFKKYEAAATTESGQNGEYISKPLAVLALAVNEPFMVLLSDGSSRLTGAAGDWLVDYGDGSLGVVAASVFERTYSIA